MPSLPADSDCAPKSIQDRNRELERLVQERTHALEKRGREMEALYQADEKILRNVSLNQVFQTLVDVAVDMLHADRSVVFAWDEKQTKVVPRVSHGYSPANAKSDGICKRRRDCRSSAGNRQTCHRHGP